MIHVPGASRPIIVDRGVTNWASRGEKGEEGEEKGEKEGEKEEEKREGSSHLTSFFMGREEFDPSSRPDVGDDFPLKKVYIYICFLLMRRREREGDVYPRFLTHSITKILNLSPPPSFSFLLLSPSQVIDADPLYVLSPTEKKLTWKFRKYLLTHFPRCLPKVCLSNK